MGKKYIAVSNSQRQELIRLIHDEGYSIVEAAKEVNIYYPTAKAINKVFRKENRIDRKAFRDRPARKLILNTELENHHIMLSF